MAEQQTTVKKRAKRPSLTPEQRQARKRTRFAEKVPRRVNGILQSLDKLARFGNRAFNSYSDEEAQRIIGRLRDAVTAVEDAFSPKADGPSLFTL